jgi:hypothetical protein
MPGRGRGPPTVPLYAGSSSGRVYSNAVTLANPPRSTRMTKRNCREDRGEAWGRGDALIATGVHDCPRG